jgi:hypothetical protein
MLASFLNYLNLTWVGVVITLITFIFAIILTVFLYFKGRQRKGLSYYISNDLLIDRANTEKPDQIEIYFSGTKVDKLYKTLIYIWNSGNQTIKKDELNTKDHLRVNIESEVLSIKIIKVTREVIDFNVNHDQENTNYKVNFDYLDQGDGAVIEVLHSGSIDDLKLQGTVMGISNIKNTESRTDNFFTKAVNESFILNSTLVSNAPLLFGTLVLIVGFIMAFVSCYLYINPETKIVTKISDANGIFIGSIIYISFGLIVIFSNKRQYPKKLEIKERKNEKTKEIDSVA